MRDVSGGYDATMVFADVTLRIPRGQFVGLVGPSGAGKTSLLKAILGGLPRVAGSVLIDGAPVTPGKPPSGAGYVPQIESVDWSFPVTVEDVVMMGRVRRMGALPWPSRDDRRGAEAILERLGLAGLGRRHIRDLSGGQQQRVFLARALVSSPRLLLLDEPTAGMSPEETDATMVLISELKAGRTIVLVEHKMKLVMKISDRVTVLHQGQILADGTPDEIRANETVQRTYLGS